MHVCARFWLFAAFGVLFGLAVAGFGIGIYNRYAAQTSANLLYNTEIGKGTKERQREKRKKKDR